jgi:DNA-binding CsgD family transcriptional regulator
MSSLRDRHSTSSPVSAASTGQIKVAVVEEHEILRRGLISALAEDQSLQVTSVELLDLVEDTEVAVISARAARLERLHCPIVICSDSRDVPGSGLTGNEVAGVLHYGTLTIAQLLATVHAAAAGLRVDARIGNRSSQEFDERTRRVLELMADGCSTREIAARMSYSERTIKKVITNLHCSLAARNRAQVVAQAIRRGLLPGSSMGDGDARAFK